jgi:subtilisin family serine protease
MGGNFSPRWRSGAGYAMNLGMSSLNSRNVFASLFALLVSGAAIAAPVDPPVPPGVDPGGVAVAIIGQGVDYTQPDIAARLARDGEGEIIGWDFVDNDRRPFPENGDYIAYVLDPQRIYRRLAKEAASSRLEFFRTTPAWVEDQHQHRMRVASAIGMAAQSPAQIVLLLHWPLPPLDEVSKRFPNVLFVATTDVFVFGEAEILPSTHYSNVLVAGGENAACDQIRSDVEIATATDCLKIDMIDADPPPSADDQVAAARITALAARLKAAEPNITAKEMKQRILNLAKPLPNDPNGTKTYGWIADPMSHFPAK